MTNEEIIDGLKFTMDMCLFSPTDGSKRPVSMLNDMDKITYNACEGAIKLLEQQRWIPVSERLPEEDGDYLVTIKWRNQYAVDNYSVVKRKYYADVKTWDDSLVIAYMPQPLPEPYKEE